MCISIRSMHLMLILRTFVYENNLDAACSRFDTTRATHFAKIPRAKKQRMCMLFTLDSIHDPAARIRRAFASRKFYFRSSIIM